MKKVFALSMALLVLAACAAPQAATPTQVGPGSNTAEAEVRALVEEFGLQLKNVSLLAPNAADQIDLYYAPYVTAELLAEWRGDPQQAPGRLTSSPWPDRIEIETIEQVTADQYRVLGSVIESTSDNQAADSYSVQLRVVRIGGAWLIAALEPN